MSLWSLTGRVLNFTNFEISNNTTKFSVVYFKDVLENGSAENVRRSGHVFFLYRRMERTHSVDKYYKRKDTKSDVIS